MKYCLSASRNAGQYTALNAVAATLDFHTEANTRTIHAENRDCEVARAARRTYERIVTSAVTPAMRRLGLVAHPEFR